MALHVNNPGEIFSLRLSGCIRVLSMKEVWRGQGRNTELEIESSASPGRGELCNGNALRSGPCTVGED